MILEVTFPESISSVPVEPTVPVGLVHKYPFASTNDAVPTKRILRPFLKDIQIFLLKNHMNYVYDGSPDQL